MNHRPAHALLCAVLAVVSWSGCTSPGTPPRVDAASVDVARDASAQDPPTADAPGGDAGCPAGLTSCGGACLDLRASNDRCGACDNRCVSRSNGAETCIAGACSLACTGAFRDCDNDRANGCETDTRADVRACGSCGNACPARPNAAARCANGVCGFECDAGFGDCDGNPANGCEVDLRASGTHCGACGRACAAGQMCGCGGACVDLMTSREHCGACGNACAATLACRAGRCEEVQRSCPDRAERGCGVVAVPGGTFVMGDDSPDGQMAARPRQESITVGAFTMDIHEVTVARFRRFWAAGHTAPTGPVPYPGGRSVMPGRVTEPTRDGTSLCNWNAPTGRVDAHPINCVDWSTALAFCAWDGGRLPTEAEWEWVARGRAVEGLMAGRRYPWGEADPMGSRTMPCDRAHWNDCFAVIYEDGTFTRRVGSFPPSGGVFDLAGNVREWAADVFAGYGDAACWGNVPRIDPLCLAPSDAAAPARAHRGSSWGNSGTLVWMRGASRLSLPPTDQDPDTGIRCVRSALSPSP